MSVPVQPTAAVRDAFARLRAVDDPAIFIATRDEAALLAEAGALEARGPAGLPLYGMPVAVKDNIDVAGLPTTAACPAYAYAPERDSTAVARLRAAGALVLGKTNLDQFATGLVGTRTPYGIPRNAFRAELVPGGSSSGSATAVAAGIVPAALGTDTAGSGRVPAALQNIVGLKPSLGLVSTAGVVPACRTLDCVTVFALTVLDAWAVLAAMAGPDAADPYSRALPLGTPGAAPAAPRLGVPRPADRAFFGDAAAAAAFDAALTRWQGLGATLVEVDFTPFAETARLLYEGPWVAERWVVTEALATRDPAALHPVTRAVVETGRSPSAADAFRALYRLQALRAAVAPVLAAVDALVVPTIPTPYTLEQVLADPIRLNSNFGTWTNFTNLLDLCGLAVPAAITPEGLPFGITLLAPAGADARLAALGAAWQVATGLKLGATGRPAPTAGFPAAAPDGIAVAVFGAHMRGLPLNRELLGLGGCFEAEIHTRPDYRCYLLPGGPPHRPGLLRVAPGEGAEIAGELWRLPPEGFGRLVDLVPAPLGFGTVLLEDGRAVRGFLVEAAGTAGAREITGHGGWRGFLAAGGP